LEIFQTKELALQEEPIVNKAAETILWPTMIPMHRAKRVGYGAINARYYFMGDVLQPPALPVEYMILQEVGNIR
jgi:hypothetical protein